MDFQQNVARNIREIRESKKLTLDAAAKLTGVSRSMLAQIEKGDVNPTISVLWKIANGYKTSFTSLVAPAGESCLLLHGEEMAPLSEDEGRYVLYPAFPFQQDTQLETYRVEIQPGGSLQAQPHMGGTEEFLTLFDGEAQITVGEETFRLGKGDSLRFRADRPHAYRSIGEKTVRMHMIIRYTNR